MHFHARIVRTAADKPRLSLSATIRRTRSGVRIKFSDGRITWLDRPQTAEELPVDRAFLDEAMRWARLHGAESTQIEDA
jgi:hypothetical protein